MNHDQFLQWLKYHQVAMPGFEAYLEHLPDKEATLDVWCDVMADVPLEDAKQASRMVASGEIPRPFPGDTVAVVRRAAKDLMANQTQAGIPSDLDGPRGLCKLCRNTGLVTVWHPLTVRAVRTGCTEFRHPRTDQQMSVAHADGSLQHLTAVVACRCERGTPFATRMVRRGGAYEYVTMGRFGDSANHVAKLSEDPTADVTAATGVFTIYDDEEF